MAYLGTGSVAAWANWDGVSDSIRDSHRVSSITDQGNAVYDVNFSPSFGNDDFAWSGSGARASNDSNCLCGEKNGSRTSSRIRLRFFDNSADAREPNFCHCITAGDMAT
tara:strand:- start:508 stop:834 length:327 start_codon:yes stop_codon:yes gene_type:complete